MKNEEKNQVLGLVAFWPFIEISSVITTFNNPVKWIRISLIFWHVSERKNTTDALMPYTRFVKLLDVSDHIARPYLIEGLSLSPPPQKKIAPLEKMLHIFDTVLFFKLYSGLYWLNLFTSIFPIFFCIENSVERNFSLSKLRNFNFKSWYRKTMRKISNIWK